MSQPHHLSHGATGAMPPHGDRSRPNGAKGCSHGWSGVRRGRSATRGSGRVLFCPGGAEEQVTAATAQSKTYLSSNSISPSKNPTCVARPEISVPPIPLRREGRGKGCSPCLHPRASTQSLRTSPVNPPPTPAPEPPKPRLRQHIEAASVPPRPSRLRGWHGTACRSPARTAGILRYA